MKILLVGATGTVGRAVAARLSKDHEVTGVSRSSSPGVDVEDPASIERLFEEVGEVDAVVSTLGHAPFKPFSELTREDYTAAFTGKTLCQIDLVRIGSRYLRDGGSVTLTTGVLSREPLAGGAATAAANGALDAYVRVVSRELPRGLRIDAVSPGVLEDSPALHSSFPGFIPVSSERVAAAFARSVEGIDTGRVFCVD